MNKKLIDWWTGGASSPYNAEVSQWVTELGNLGYSVPPAQTLGYLSTLCDNIGTTIISKLEFLFPFALGHTDYQNAASVDLIRLIRGSYVNSPNFSSTGVRGDGSTSYFDTSFEPSTEATVLSLNSVSFGGWVKEAATVGSYHFGTLTSGMYFRRTNSSDQRINAVTVIATAFDGTGTGYKAVNRTTSTNVQYFNELVRTDSTQTSWAVGSGNFCFGRTSAGYSNARFSFGFLGASLSEAEHNTLRNAINTYLTSMGL